MNPGQATAGTAVPQWTARTGPGMVRLPRRRDVRLIGHRSGYDKLLFTLCH